MPISIDSLEAAMYAVIAQYETAYQLGFYCEVAEEEAIDFRTRVLYDAGLFLAFAWRAMDKVAAV